MLTIILTWHDIQKPDFEDKVDCVPCQINKRYHMTYFGAITTLVKEICASVIGNAIWGNVLLLYQK